MGESDVLDAGKGLLGPGIQEDCDAFLGEKVAEEFDELTEEQSKERLL